jgi:hypothetical protein
LWALCQELVRSTTHRFVAASGVDLSFADLRDASIAEKQFHRQANLKGATMLDGQKYEDWIIDTGGTGKDVENE